jgi:hypothetical protein
MTHMIHTGEGVSQGGRGYRDARRGAVQRYVYAAGQCDGRGGLRLRRQVYPIYCIYLHDLYIV